MSDIAWELSHSVESTAGPSFAWAYMTNVANWDDPPAEFELDGPFVTGAQGRTRIPGREPTAWQLVAVDPARRTYTLAAALDRATLSFEWRFEPCAGGTRLTQKIVLAGENAAEYLPPVRDTFSATLAPGMERIAQAMGRAASVPPA